MMLKAPDHQVGGKPGPQIDDLGYFYKPVQKDDDESTEVAFYTSFSSNTNIPDNIRRFFPIFHGTQLIEALNGSGMHPHIVLQDVVGNRIQPSVMDIKIGSRTWTPQSSEDYIQKCLKKDRLSTSLPLGFRISGLRIYQNEKLGFYKPDKKLIHSFTVEDVRLCLKKFVSSNVLSDSEPDCAFASVVYGGPDGILARLLELKSWFEDQTAFRFKYCSVLMIYAKEAAEAGRSLADVKLVDFAHVMEGQGVIDHNFLGGICSLIKFVSEILTNNPDDKKGRFCFENGISQE